MAALFLRTSQTFRDALELEDFETGDLVLLNFMMSTPQWREGLVDFLLNITGDDPQRILDRAIESGRLRADDDGHLYATEKVDALIKRLLPAAQEFNHTWRGELADRFSTEDLNTFLGMLQHASR